MTTLRPILQPVLQPLLRSVFDPPMRGGGDPLLKAILKLFANGEQGGAWDFTRPERLFQDAGGTLPVATYGDPIGMAADLSGNGNHLLQTTVPSRPTYTEDGALHDGVDDFLMAAHEEDWTFLHDGSGGTLATSLMVQDVEGGVGNKMTGTRTSGIGFRVGVAHTGTMQGLADIRGDLDQAATSVYTPHTERGIQLAYIGQTGPEGVRLLSNYGDSSWIPVEGWSDSPPQYELRTITATSGRPVPMRRLFAISRVLSDPECALVNAWLMEGVE